MMCAVRMVVIFDDCCHKIDLRFRHIKLQVSHRASLLHCYCLSVCVSVCHIKIQVSQRASLLLVLLSVCLSVTLNYRSVSVLHCYCWCIICRVCVNVFFLSLIINVSCCFVAS